MFILQDFPHKALHPKSSPGYEKAAEEEKRLLERDVVMRNQEIRKREEAEERLKVELEKKNREADMLQKYAGDLSKKVERLEAMRSMFQVEKKDEDEQLSDTDIDRFKKLSSDNFCMMKLPGVVGVLKNGVEIKVNESGGSGSFSLQDFFDSLYEKGGDANVALFGDNNSTPRIARLVLSQWKVRVYTFASFICWCMFSHIAVCITIYEYRSYMINRKRLITQRLLEVCFLYDMCVGPICYKIQLSCCTCYQLKR